MLKYQDFVEQYSAEYGGLAKKIAEFMEDREISSLMGDDLYEYFGTKTAIGHTVFYRLKNALIDFVEYSCDPNKDKVIARISKFSQLQLAKRIDERASTYKSLDEILDLLNQIVTEKNLHSTDAVPLQSMAIFVWMNYSNADISEFKVSDIDELQKLDNKYKEILRTYAGLKCYRVLPSRRVRNLVQSEYLFRTASKNKLNESDIAHIISKINSLVADKNKSFTRVVIERSVAFIEIYDKYKLDITPEIIRNYFGKSIKKAEVDKLIFEYKKWAEQF